MIQLLFFFRFFPDAATTAPSCIQNSLLLEKAISMPASHINHAGVLQTESINAGIAINLRLSALTI
jgi:hypothetical protein